MYVRSLEFIIYNRLLLDIVVQNNILFIFLEVQSHKNALLLPKPPSCGPIKPTTRIMGGSDAAVGEFPWIVLLKIHSKFNLFRYI